MDRSFILEYLPKQTVGAEIGVYQGDFSEQILKICMPKKLHLIDPWRYETSMVYEEALYGGAKGQSQVAMDEMYAQCLARFKPMIDRSVVVIHRDTSAAVCSTFEDEYFDWVYVDGNHRYEFVKADLVSYFRKIKVGGLLLGDDYDCPNSWWADGVTTAVNEFVATAKMQIVCVYQHQFCLRKL